MRLRLLHLTALGAGLMILASLGSCAEEDTDFHGPDPELVVRVAPSRLPVEGITVVVMDRATNLAVAGPKVTDVDGRCVFAGLPEGWYSLVAFGGAEYYIVSNEDGLSGGDKTSPAPPPAEILVGLRQIPGDLPRISGQVVDDATGAPLQAAFVSTSPFMNGYVGETTYKDDVTLADGRFTVSEIAMAQDPDSGRLLQVEPLLVTCAGYRPLSWTHHFGNGDNNLDITGVTIRLQPVQAQDTGVLTGRLLLEEAPASGVAVGLGGVATEKSAVGQPGYLAVTDAEGVFRFTGLPGGVYFVQPGFLPGDGFVYPDQPGNIGQPVTPDEETVTGDLLIMREVQLYYPPNGWDYFGPEWLEPFQWAAVPGATRYTVYLDRGIVGETETTSIGIPNDWTLNPGPHFWYVVAYNAQDQVIGASEVTGLFFIIEPANP